MQEGTKLCPKCYKVVPKDAVLCPYCGYRFPQKIEEEKTSKCPNCGREIPSDAVLCPYCGYRIVKYQPPQPVYVTYEERRPKKKYDYFTKPLFQKIRKIAIPLFLVLGIIFNVVSNLSMTLTIEEVPQSAPQSLQEQYLSISGIVLGFTILILILIIATFIFAFLIFYNYKFSLVVAALCISILVLWNIANIYGMELLRVIDKAGIKYSYTISPAGQIATVFAYLSFITVMLLAVEYYIGESTKEKKST